MENHTIKLFSFDLNRSRFERPVPFIGTSAPQDWAFIDPREYFDYHVAMGNNVMFCQAYAHCGYAFYPTKLGPVAPGPGSELLPRLFDLSKNAGMPFWTYFCAGIDLIVGATRTNWLIPGSYDATPWRCHGFLAPESPWTDLLCDRVYEFLCNHPVDWILFDWFVYGSLKPDEFRVQPAWFVEKPFQEIIGRHMPDTASDISPTENLNYKREVMAWQFYRIKDAVKAGSPNTKIIFNVPYSSAREALWVDHPMLNESDGLFAECSKDEVVEWLLSIRRPNQRVMTTVIGRLEEGECDPSSWRKWHEKGCDLCGYVWGSPPEIKPHPSYWEGLEIIRRAFMEI